MNLEVTIVGIIEILAMNEKEIKEIIIMLN